jgi:ubiquinone/menaquinone biosynthesis C-methylase UbiE
MDLERITRHYQTDEQLTETVLEAIREEKSSLENLSLDDLIAIDGFHTRGKKATVELSGLLSPRPGSADSVLDLGSGSGGTARYLATRFGCRVTGLDLTPSYVKLSRALSGLLGISEKTAFVCGNALALPFASEVFDLVWSDHVQMNISDKALFAREIHRVLKPGGSMAVHEVFSGASEAPAFPLPWASEADSSFTVKESRMRRILEKQGLFVSNWEDVTEISAAWFEKMQKKNRPTGRQALGLHLLMGPFAKEKIANMGRNLSEGRVRVIMGVVQKQKH